MNLASVIARLKAQLTAFRQIGGAADLEAVDGAASVAVPAAFVLPLSERAGQVAHLSGAPQQIDVRFLVVLVISNRRDATGAAALNDLQARRDQVLAALRGWKPTGALAAPMWQGGDVMRFADAQLWWGDEFACTAYA